ncbi:hypothetical protein KC867_03510 [Candidatus Saccharibacteria bacterium]|nr:hypothetical protein [Candidatus Saccharibacteria bacterium]
MGKTILAFISFIFLILVIVIIVAKGGSDNSSTVSTRAKLSESANSEAVFTFTERGPIVADEDHYNIQITVNRHTRVIKILKGYEGNVVATQSFTNNQEAFSDFVSALENAGYEGKKSTKYASEEGVCPAGRRYVFESNQFDEDFRRWTSNCDVKGDFAGSLSVIQGLYKDQIPEYNKFISETRASTGLSL